MFELGILLGGIGLFMLGASALLMVLGEMAKAPYDADPDWLRAGNVKR